MSLPSTHSTKTAQPILSIGMLSQRIRRQLAPMLTKQTYLLQAQWIKPQANKGQKGFFSVTLADTDNPNMAIDAMIWEPAVIRKVLEQGQQFGHDLLSRDSRVEVVVEATLVEVRTGRGVAGVEQPGVRPECDGRVELTVKGGMLRIGFGAWGWRGRGARSRLSLLAIVVGAEVLEQTAPITDAAPVAPGGSPAARFHPDVKAVVTAVGTERARPFVEPGSPGPAHGVKPGMQLLRVAHGNALPPPLPSGMAMPSRVNVVDTRVSGWYCGRRSPARGFGSDEDDHCRQASGRPRLFVFRSGWHGLRAHGEFKEASTWRDAAAGSRAAPARGCGAAGPRRPATAHPD